MEEALANGTTNIRRPRNISVDKDAVLEGEGIYYLREMEECSDESKSAAQRVRATLQAEREGSAPCGQCAGCCKSAPCVRARARLGAQQGNDGSRWAIEGEALKGRQFLVRCC